MHVTFNDTCRSDILPNNLTDNANPEFTDKVVLEMRDTFFCAMISDVLDGLKAAVESLTPVSQ